MPGDTLSSLRPACEAGLTATITVGNERFTSTLLDLYEDRLILDSPRPAHGATLMTTGAEITIDYLFAGIPHQVVSRVMGVEDGEVIVARPDAVARLQRRRYFRVQPDDGVSATLKIGEERVVRTLVDVSAGGIGLRLGEGDTLGSGAKAIVQIPLGEGTSFLATGVIRHIESRETAVGRERVAGVEFDDLTARERERLVAWVSTRERELLQRRQRQRAVVPRDAVVVLHGPANRVRIRAAVDVSTGGVSVLAMKEDADLVPGARVIRAELRLPGEAPFVTSLLVRQQRQLQTAGSTQTITSLEIDRMPAAEGARLGRALERYVPVLQRLVRG